MACGIKGQKQSYINISERLGKSIIIKVRGLELQARPLDVFFLDLCLCLKNTRLCKEIITFLGRENFFYLGFFFWFLLKFNHVTFAKSRDLFDIDMLEKCC